MSKRPLLVVGPEGFATEPAEPESDVPSPCRLVGWAAATSVSGLLTCFVVVQAFREEFNLLLFFIVLLLMSIITMFTSMAFYHTWDLMTDALDRTNMPPAKRRSQFFERHILALEQSGTLREEQRRTKRAPKLPEYGRVFTLHPREIPHCVAWLSANKIAYEITATGVTGYLDDVSPEQRRAEWEAFDAPRKKWLELLRKGRADNV